MNKTPEILRKQRKGLDKKKKSVKCTTSETYCSGRKMEKQGEEPRKRPGNMVKNHKTEGLKAVKTSGNIYYQARMRAAARDPLHSSRERTATLLYISKESLQDFETGKRLPPCDVVQKMVEAYGAPELAGDHIRAAVRCCRTTAATATANWRWRRWAGRHPSRMRSSWRCASRPWRGMGKSRRTSCLPWMPSAARRWSCGA